MAIYNVSKNFLKDLLQQSSFDCVSLRKLCCEKYSETDFFFAAMGLMLNETNDDIDIILAGTENINYSLRLSILNEDSLSFKETPLSTERDTACIYSAYSGNEAVDLYDPKGNKIDSLIVPSHECPGKHYMDLGYEVQFRKFGLAKELENLDN